MEPTDARANRIPPNSCPEILPVKGKKRNARARVPASRGRARARRVPCTRPRPFGRVWWLMVVLFVVVTTVPAFADTEPQLVSTFPAHLGAERSDAVDGITATYDRDINGFTSKLRVFDKDGTELDGVSDLAGPLSDTGGKRTIRFTPFGTLSEAKSPYTAKAKAFALAGGDAAFDEWTFEIDDTPPPPPVITDPSDGDVRDDQPALALGTAEPGAFIDIVEDTATIAGDRATIDGDFSVVLPYPDEDGVSHTIAAVAIDRAGNRSDASAPVTFIHDNIEVIPRIITPEQGEHLNASAVHVSGTAKPGSTVTIREGGAAVGSASVDAAGEWATSIFFVEGTHVITAEAFDGVNTDGPSAARTFTVDVTPPPVPTIDAPAAGASLPSHDVVVAGTAEPDTFVRVREGTLLRATIPVDGAGGWSGTITFSEGSHSITAAGEDRAGNLSPASAPRSFTVDTAAPAPPVIDAPAQDAFEPANAVTVAGAAEAGSTVRVIEGTVTLGQATADGAGAWSVVIGFPDGAHSIHAVAVDAAGNVSPDSALRSFTVDTVAPAAPTITHPDEGAFLTSTEVFVAGTGEPGVLVEVLEGATVVGAATPDGASNWSVWISFAPGAHTITARATDVTGHVSPLSSARSFTVSTSSDVTPPPPPTITDPGAGAVVGPTPLFAGTGEPGATIEVFEGATPLGSATADGAGEWRFSRRMSPGGHTVTATATDPAGNVSGASPPRSFTVDATRPVVGFTTGNLSVFLPAQPVALEGTADDNVGVAAVGVEIYDQVTGMRVATIAAACDGCPGSPVTWEAGPALLPGLYRARAIATDVADNGSFPADITFLVL